MKIEIKNQQGNKIKEVELPNTLNLKFNKDLVYQVVYILLQNKRLSYAHTKDRSEVSGGGRKPWAQKGTGRARHGSIRSPLWKGGGVTFGPRKEKIFQRELPKKIKRKALLMVLAQKIKNNFLLVIDNFNINKAKEALTLFKNLGIKTTKKDKIKESILVLLGKNDLEKAKFFRNLEKVKILPVNKINALYLLNSKYILIDEKTLNDILDNFLK
ncbi:MAG: 50S ribosomal protein L4 [Minisyncoccia bacterium]